MLVEFSTKNFLSIKDTITLSMVAASVPEHKELNTFEISNLRLLKSAAIYGANASGKSNLIKAMNFVKNFIINSSKNFGVNEKIPIEPFKLCALNENFPSYFEFVFYVDEVRYRYNLEVNKESIVSENLYFTPSRNEAMLFEREKENIKIGNYFKEGKGLESKTRSNALFLSVVAQFNGEKALKIYEWFDKLYIMSGLKDNESIFRTLDYIDSEESLGEVAKFLRRLDVSIQDLKKEENIFDASNMPENIPQVIKDNLLKNNTQVHAIEILSKHKLYDENGTSVGFTEFDLDENESEGTKKIFSLAGIFLDAMKKSKIIVIDEFDARLHPLLSRDLILFFHNVMSKECNSQLIFTTHDVKLMNRKLFRRDQIWFTAKDSTEATKLYSLIEYKKGIRNDEVFEKNYLDGRYGAIPYFNEVQNSFLS